MAWNKDAKRRHHLREMGRPSLIRPDEVERVKAHLAWLHDEHAMSWCEIAVEAHLTPNGTGLSKLMSGNVKGMRRSNYEAVMRVQPIPPGREERVGGAFVSFLGAQRRLQALMCIGFSMNRQDEIAGWGQYAARRIINGRNNETDCLPLKHIYASRDAEAKALYEKLCDADPAAYGINKISRRRAESLALARGYAPPHCWDDDTIDDPRAHPEWTGRCGTMPGAVIHLRTGSPICDRCMRSVENKKNVVDIYELHRVYQLNKSHEESAKLLGIGRDLYSQYAQFLRPEERVFHTLSMVDKVAMTGYCEACRDQVHLYKHLTDRYTCSNRVKKYQEEKGQ